MRTPARHPAVVYLNLVLCRCADLPCFRCILQIFKGITSCLMKHALGSIRSPMGSKNGPRRMPSKDPALCCRGTASAAESEQPWVVNWNLEAMFEVEFCTVWVLGHITKFYEATSIRITPCASSNSRKLRLKSWSECGTYLFQNGSHQFTVPDIKPEPSWTGHPRSPTEFQDSFFWFLTG